MILRRDTYETRRWRNGGGISHEIAWEATEGWRFSLAEIVRAGPFSDYAGVDRTLTVVDGTGLALNGLALGTEPHSFAGEDAIMATLTGGPMLVLNVLTQRERFGHSVRRMAAPMELLGTSWVVALGPLVVNGAALGTLDAMRLDGAAAAITGEAELVAITVFAR